MNGRGAALRNALKAKLGVGFSSAEAGAGTDCQIMPWNASATYRLPCESNASPEPRRAAKLNAQLALTRWMEPFPLSAT
jgi:hypothetical protein